MLQLFLHAEKYLRGLIDKCPIEAGMKIVVPDQTLPSVPRKGQGPDIPSGYYRFLFEFRATQPNVTLGNLRGLW
jgi:hypothetical protein